MESELLIEEKIEDICSKYMKKRNYKIITGKKILYDFVARILAEKRREKHVIDIRRDGLFPIDKIDDINNIKEAGFAFWWVLPKKYINYEFRKKCKKHGVGIYSFDGASINSVIEAEYPWTTKNTPLEDILKIFISSEFNIVERREAPKIIRDMGHNAIMLDAKQAYPEVPDRVWESKINKCGIVVCILLADYSKSVDKEITYALKSGKSVLIFIKDNFEEMRDRRLKSLIKKWKKKVTSVNFNEDNFRRRLKDSINITIGKRFSK